MFLKWTLKSSLLRMVSIAAIINLFVKNLKIIVIIEKTWFSTVIHIVFYYQSHFNFKE